MEKFRTEVTAGIGTNVGLGRLGVQELPGTKT